MPTGELIEPLAVVDRGGGAGLERVIDRATEPGDLGRAPAGADSAQAIRLSKSVLICVTAMPSVMGSIDRPTLLATPRGGARRIEVELIAEPQSAGNCMPNCNTPDD